VNSVPVLDRTSALCADKSKKEQHKPNHKRPRLFDADEGSWVALSGELGEALLGTERTFLDVVDRRHMSRLARDDAARVYLAAWSRLASVHRLMAIYLLE
jgi:hypothetical protein